MLCGVGNKSRSQKGVQMIIVFLFVLFFAFFSATPVAYGGSQDKGWNQSYSCWPTTQPQQCKILTTSATYTTAHSNAGSLTHLARLGIKPTITWFLVIFVSTAPHWNS